MNVRILRSATRTLAEGIRFYERQQAGLGAYFLTSIMSDLRSLRTTGGSHQKFNDSYQRMICRKFPYSIYYQSDGSKVNVFAVLDDRRDPEWIKEMLGRLA